MLLMDEKNKIKTYDKWNLSAGVAVSGRFDAEYPGRGRKGVAATAACMMWLLTPDADKRIWIELAKALDRKRDEETLDGFVSRVKPLLEAIAKPQSPSPVQTSVDGVRLANLEAPAAAQTKATPPPAPQKPRKAPAKVK